MPLFALLASLLTAGQHVPPPVIYEPPPPAAIESDTPFDATPQLIVLRPGDVECSGIVEQPVRRELPIPEAQRIFSREPIRPLTLTFAIDATGRPIDIDQRDARATPGLDTGDAIPALAAWQFAPGTARTGCTMSYTVNHLHAPDVPIDDAERAFAFRRGNSPEMQPFYKQTIPAGSDCFDPFPAYRMQAYPAYDTLDRRPGSATYAMVGFDVDRRGRTRNVQLIGGDRDSAIAEAGLDAVRDSRFVPGARLRCALPFSLLPQRPLEAPPGPPASVYLAADAACDGVPGNWASMPPLVFPSGFNRRSIEGWAVVRYDVAPWGAVGNISVVAAEPAAAFGEAAKSIIARATKPPSKRGYSGCVQRVNFKIRPSGAPASGYDVGATSS